MYNICSFVNWVKYNDTLKRQNQTKDKSEESLNEIKAFVFTQFSLYMMYFFCLIHASWYNCM